MGYLIAAQAVQLPGAARCAQSPPVLRQEEPGNGRLEDGNTLTLWICEDEPSYISFSFFVGLGRDKSRPRPRNIHELENEESCGRGTGPKQTGTQQTKAPGGRRRNERSSVELLALCPGRNADDRLSRDCDPPHPFRYRCGADRHSSHRLGA